MLAMWSCAFAGHEAQICLRSSNSEDVDKTVTMSQSLANNKDQQIRKWSTIPDPENNFSCGSS